MTRTLRTVSRQLVESHGWQSGTDLEDRVAWQLHRWNVRPHGVKSTPRGFSTARPLDVHQQYPVGNYRLDFAWPDVKAALEADGGWHRTPDVAVRDATRDVWLRDQGWLVFRVHDNPETLPEQLVRVVVVVRSLYQHY